MRFFRDYSADFEELLLQVGALKSRTETKFDKSFVYFNEVDDRLTQIEKQQDKLLSELTEIKQLLLNKEPIEMVEEEIEIDDECEYSFGRLGLGSSAKREFKYTELDDRTFTFEYKVRNRPYRSNWNAFDVLILKGLENEDTWATWTDLNALMGLGYQTTQRIAYNLARGFFEKWDLENLLTFSKEYGLLYVNGKKTKVPIKTVKYIVSCMLNSNNPYTTLLKLKKSGECSDFMYSVIGANYSNPQLTGLLNASIDVPIENNREKREELGI